MPIIKAVLVARLSGTRRLGILFLLCALVAAQVVFFASVELHEHSAQQCCALCHSGSLVFQQPSASWSVAPALSVVWLEPLTDLDAMPAMLLTAGESRAPPEPFGVAFIMSGGVSPEPDWAVVVRPGIPG